MEKNIIIAISGKIGAGKNAIADLIKQHSILKFEETAFAKKLKEIVALLAAVPYETTLTQEGKNIYIEEYGKTIGEMLQIIGTDCMRDTFNKQVWIKACLLEIKNKPGNYIITDCRFDNEADAIKEIGGYVIRINRKNNPIAAASGRDLNHPSETGLDNYNNFDYVINNDGTLEDLEHQVVNILKEIELMAEINQ
jgi:hypothetical protein